MSNGTDFGTVARAKLELAFNDALVVARELVRAKIGDENVETRALILVWTVTILCALFALRVLSGVGRALGGSSSSTRKTQKPAVLLFGPSGSGKTVMWQVLSWNEHRFPTITSLEPNEEGACVIKGKTSSGKEKTKSGVRVVDVPGYGKLRPESFAQLKRATALVFVVDSVTFAADRKEVAKLLFDVLSHEDFQKKRIPLLIACNKAEKLTAHPPDFIRKRLEREIEVHRSASAGSLPSIAVTAAQRKAAVKKEKLQSRLRTLGQRPGEVFSFEAYSATFKTPVSVGRVSASKNDLAAVRDFIVQHAR